MFAHNIFLIGFMGTGKSTVAAKVGEKYDMNIIEMDQLIAEREGMSIPDIFAKNGEQYFRGLETKLLKEIQEGTNSIVSCGGGAVLRQENVDLMKKGGKVVLLTASPEEIYARVKDDDGRPLLKGRKNVAAIAELMEQRREKYEMAADIVISTDGKTAGTICMELVEYLKETKEG